MSVPTTGECYAKLMENLRHAQENSAMMAHLIRDDDRRLAEMWLLVSENFKKLQHSVTELARGRLQ
jgi:hypothetical protein